MEQTDIVPILQEFQVQIDDSDELVVMNPPVVELKSDSSDEDEKHYSEHGC